MNDEKKMRYDEHGYTEFTKKNSCQLVQRQRQETEYGSKEVWYATELGQPFLFWDGGGLDISGVLDYSGNTQTGTFIHGTITGELRVKNVHSYHVFFYIEGKYLPGNSRYLPEPSEVNDIYLSAIVKTGNEFQLNIYHNTKLVYQQNDVFPEEYIFYGENTAYKSRLSYVRYAEKTELEMYQNYLYDIKNENVYRLDESQANPSWYIDYREHAAPEWSRFRDKIINNKNLKIILHLDSSKTAQIVSEYIKTADKCTRLENLFDDDDTINLEVTYNNKPEQVRFLYYCASKNKDIFGQGIFGLTVDNLEKGTKNNKYEYKNFLLLTEDELRYYKNLNKDLYIKCGEEMAINRLPLLIIERYISAHDMIVYMYQYLRDIAPDKYEVPWILGYMGKTNFSFDNEKKKYDEIFNKITREERLSTKWKNEYSLFKLVKKEYDDAIYQYHAKWLEHQSLDIFVPSIKTAFEYQGRQHYEAVMYFGGEEQLKRQKLRDLKKQEKCAMQGVKLIEWKYDEPVSKLVFDKKINNCH